jgi:hypothetical protein
MLKSAENALDTDWFGACLAFTDETSALFGLKFK